MACDIQKRISIEININLLLPWNWQLIVATNGCYLLVKANYYWYMYFIGGLRYLHIELAESAYTLVTDGYSPVINISPSPINRPSQNKISPSRIILYIFNYSKFFFNYSFQKLFVTSLYHLEYRRDRWWQEYGKVAALVPPVSL